MRDDKDRSGKWLIERHGDSLLLLSGVHGFESWRAVANEVVLPKKVPDGLLDVTFPGQPTPDLFLLEIEAYADREHEKQVMEDVAVVFGARGVLPEVISIVLRPRGEFRLSGEKKLVSRLGNSRLTFQWHVVELWTIESKEMLAFNDVGLIPLVPLMHHEGSPESLIQTCRDRIEQQASPNERNSLLVLTQVMTAFAYSDRNLIRLLEGHPIMLRLISESPLIKELLAEVSAQVTAQVTLQTRAKTLQTSVLDNLETRFGELPKEIALAVQGIQDDQRLRELHRFAIRCSDLETFHAELGS